MFLRSAPGAFVVIPFGGLGPFGGVLAERRIQRGQQAGDPAVLGVLCVIALYWVDAGQPLVAACPFGLRVLLVLRPVRRPVLRFLELCTWR